VYLADKTYLDNIRQIKCWSGLLISPSPHFFHNLRVTLHLFTFRTPQSLPTGPGPDRGRGRQASGRRSGWGGKPYALCSAPAICTWQPTILC